MANGFAGDSSAAGLGALLRKWWESASDDEKQQALDTVGELAGGTLGAMAGGPTPLAIPGAGAGSVAGKSAAHFTGKALGLKTSPQTGSQAAADAAATFATNAAGEGVGRAIPYAYKGTKALAQRAAKWAVGPDPEVVRLAGQAGVELTPGMASTSPLVKMSESALEKLPGGTTPVRDKTIQAVEKWEQNARQIPQQFHASPVTETDAGTALQSQLAENRGAASAHFRPKYSGINAHAGDAPIDFTIARDQAQQFLDGLPQGMESYFPGGAMKKLRQIAGMPNGQRIPGNAMIDGPNPVMTFAEAQQLRTGLLEAERAMSHGDAAVQRRAIPALRDAVDNAIDDSLSNSTNPAYQQALSDWRATNRQFADTAKTLYPHGKEGNPTTATIEGAKRPEALMSLSKSPTNIQQAEQAVTPMFAAADQQAMPKFRRAAADNLLEGSRTQNRFVGDERYINPRRMEKALDEGSDAYQTLFGAGPYQEFRDSSKLGKAITSPTQLTNTSETARFHNLIRYGTAPALATVGAVLSDDDWKDRAKGAAEGLAAGVLAPRLAAKAWLGPVARAVTTPTRALPKFGESGALLGTASRSIMAMPKFEQPAGASGGDADYILGDASDSQPDYILGDATPQRRR